MNLKIKQTFYAVGLELLRVEGVVILQYSVGLFNAPDFSAVRALSLALLIAMLAAALKAVQVWLPKLTWAGVIKNKVVSAWADAFTRVALASFISTELVWLAAPDYSTWKSVLHGAVTGGLAAGARALQGLVHPDATADPRNA